jgi:hypothetical protein
MLPQYADKIKELGKGIIFIGHSFVMGILGNEQLYNIDAVEQLCKSFKANQPINQNDPNA